MVGRRVPSPPGRGTESAPYPSPFRPNWSFAVDSAAKWGKLPACRILPPPLRPAPVRRPALHARTNSRRRCLSARNAISGLHPDEQELATLSPAWSAPAGPRRRRVPHRPPALKLERDRIPALPTCRASSRARPVERNRARERPAGVRFLATALRVELARTRRPARGDAVRSSLEPARPVRNRRRRGPAGAVPCGRRRAPRPPARRRCRPDTGIPRRQAAAPCLCGMQRGLRTGAGRVGGSILLPAFAPFRRGIHGKASN